MRDYFRNIYESVVTIADGMRITFQTAFFERKVTLQYPSHDVLEGRLRDVGRSGSGAWKRPFEAALGADQKYRGPLLPRVADRFRGLLGYEESLCIGCRLCAVTCPIDVIEVRAVKIEGRKSKAPVTFRIDYAKCMFCGLCVEACPASALFFTHEFEAATFDCRTLSREFIRDELRIERLQKAQQKRGEKIDGTD